MLAFGVIAYDGSMGTTAVASTTADEILLDDELYSGITSMTTQQS